MPISEILRDRITRVIAATRFPFINQEDWDEDRRTLVNTRREKLFSIKGPSSEIYPSIIVLNPDGSVREIGEVEMEVYEGLVTKWQLLSKETGMGEKYKKLFVYVPSGLGVEAQRLLEENEVEYVGLREWSIESGVLVTKPVKTPDMEYDHRIS